MNCHTTWALQTKICAFYPSLPARKTHSEVLSESADSPPPSNRRKAPGGSLDLIAISPTGRSPETAPPSVRAAGCRDHPEGSAAGLRCQKEGAGLVEFSLHCDPGLFGSSCKGGVATCFLGKVSSICPCCGFSVCVPVCMWRGRPSSSGVNRQDYKSWERFLPEWSV